jgi:ATP-dependent DNA helicase RecQ
VACCDICDPDAAPAFRASSSQPRERSERRPSARRTSDPVAIERLDRAIVEVVVSARPSVGRTRAVEILRGGRSKVIVENRYDALELYGAFADLGAAETLAAVDALIDRGVLRSTGGRFPKLALGGARLAA